MSLSKTLPCHLDSLMEILNILWPLTWEKVSYGHQMCFYGSMLAFICVQYFAVQAVIRKSNILLFLLFHLAIFSHPSLPSVSGDAYGSHAEKHKANNTNMLISHTTELPLTHCFQPGPPMEMVLFDEAGEKGKDSKQRGALSSPFPQGLIISRHRDCW